MGFSNVQVARGRVTRLYEGVSGGIGPIGKTKTPTAKLYIPAPILKASGLKIGAGVQILLGSGNDEGKLRLVASDTAKDVTIRIEATPTTGYICSRLIPRGGHDKYNRKDIVSRVISDGVLEIDLPWITRTADFLEEDPPERKDDPWKE